MKKVKLALIVLCTFLLTGCVQSVDVTDQESDVLSEYMAGTVLKYDKNYDEALIIPKNTTEETKEETIENSDETKQAEETKTNDSSVVSNASDKISETDKVTNETETDGHTGNSSNQNQDLIEPVSVHKELGSSDFDLSYTGYQLYDQYGADERSYYSIEADADKKLIVISFLIKNVTDKAQTINLLEMGLNYQLNVDNTKYNPIMSLLVNDIQYFSLNIAANKSEKAVIVFEVSDKQMSNIQLSISNGDKKADIKIK